MWVPPTPAHLSIVFPDPCAPFLAGTWAWQGLASLSLGPRPLAVIPQALGWGLVTGSHPAPQAPPTAPATAGPGPPRTPAPSSWDDSKRAAGGGASQGWGPAGARQQVSTGHGGHHPGTAGLTVTCCQEAGLFLSIGAWAKRCRQGQWGRQPQDGWFRGGGPGAETVPMASGRATGGRALAPRGPGGPRGLTWGTDEGKAERERMK